MYMNVQSHCPWTGNCIGERNYRYFFVFLVSLSILTLHVTYTSILLFWQYYLEINIDGKQSSKIVLTILIWKLWKVACQHWIIWSIGFLILLCSWSLISLTAFHALIISKAQTTNEQVRGIYKNNGPQQQEMSTVNIYDKGFCSNWITTFCSPIRQSYIPSDFGQCVIIPTDQSDQNSDLEKTVHHSNNKSRIQSYDSLTPSSSPNAIRYDDNHHANGNTLNGVEEREIV